MQPGFRLPPATKKSGSHLLRLTSIQFHSNADSPFHHHGVSHQSFTLKSFDYYLLFYRFHFEALLHREHSRYFLSRPPATHWKRPFGIGHTPHRRPVITACTLHNRAYDRAFITAANSCIQYGRQCISMTPFTHISPSLYLTEFCGSAPLSTMLQMTSPQHLNTLKPFLTCPHEQPRAKAKALHQLCLIHRTTPPPASPIHHRDHANTPACVLQTAAHHLPDQSTSSLHQQHNPHHTLATLPKPTVSTFHYAVTIPSHQQDLSQHYTPHIQHPLNQFHALNSLFRSST